MKYIDESSLLLCKYQAGLFEYATIDKKINSANFIKAFSFSDLSKRIDDEAFIYDSLSIAAAFDELKKEKILRSTGKTYPAQVMSWIGYLMRYWSILYSVSTITIYKTIKPNELYNLYESYHSLDIEVAINRILEAKNKYKSLNDIDLFRKIYL